MERKGGALKYAANGREGDKEGVLAAIAGSKYHSHVALILECASEVLQSDKKVVLAAVTKHGRALAHASTQRKEEDRWRRTSNASAPHTAKFDEDGVEVVPNNIASKYFGPGEIPTGKAPHCKLPTIQE